VPWLSRFPASLDVAIPIIKERLIWWMPLFLLSILFGTIIKKGCEYKSLRLDKNKLK
jgi:hypothetical protein